MHYGNCAKVNSAFASDRCAIVLSVPAAVDNEKKMKIYRAVSGLTTEQIIHQDEDGDT